MSIVGMGSRLMSGNEPEGAAGKDHLAGEQSRPSLIGKDPVRHCDERRFACIGLEVKYWPVAHAR